MERHASRPRPRQDRPADRSALGTPDAPRARFSPALLALPAILLGALALRLWGIRHGLPFSYNADEEGHFVPVAIGFFGHSLNPRYFLNPPGYTELLYLVYAVWFHGRDAVAHAYAADPAKVFLLARLTVAALGVVTVWLLHLAGKRLFDRGVGLLAAGLGAVAFLPVSYSHLALNDVPTMAPATLALLCAALVLKRGGVWPVLLGGVAVGLAAGTKYTAGIVVLPLLTAAAIRTWEERASVGHAFGAFALTAFAALVGFLIANPYALLSFSEFHTGISSQKALAGGQELSKLGLTQQNGVLYYLWSFTWGLGWVPSILAVLGALRLMWKQRAVALTLIPTVLVYLAYMGTQDRYFGRWLLPVFPIVIVLAAYGTLWIAREAGRRFPRIALPATIVLVLAVVAQGLVTVVHNDRVLSRTDTRTSARSWMLANIPAGTPIVLEPIVPSRWSEDPLQADPATPTGQRWQLWDTTRSDVDDNARPLPGGRTRYVRVDKYERTLRPELIDKYKQAGYCWVVVGSDQRDRAFAQPAEAPQAIAYYDALAREGRLAARFSPYHAGAHPPTFNFDWNFDFYPLAYERPGPELWIYKLSGGNCS